jgi:hypothetical protein
MLAALYDIADTQRLWPLLQEVEALGIAKERKQDFAAIKNLLPKIVSYETPPEKYQPLIKRIMTTNIDGRGPNGANADPKH